MCSTFEAAPLAGGQGQVEAKGLDALRLNIPLLNRLESFIFSELRLIIAIPDTLSSDTWGVAVPSFRREDVFKERYYFSEMIRERFFSIKSRSLCWSDWEILWNSTPTPG